MTFNCAVVASYITETV